MSAPPRLYADTPFGQVHCRSVGGQGPPVVLLHRTPVDSSCFDAVLARLDGQRSAVALDTPGFGQSFQPSGSPIAADYGRWFLAGLDSLGVEAFHLFAHHTGTHFAVEMAKAAPDRVISLMLSGVLYVDPAERVRVRKEIGRALPIDPDGRYLAATWATMRGLFPQYDANLVHREVLGALASPRGRDQAFGAIFAQDFASVLAQVRCPVRILQAEDDPLGFCLERVRAAHPEIPIRLHGPAGMAAPERQPDAIVGAILAFIDAQAPPHARKMDTSMTDQRFELVRTPTGFDLHSQQVEPPTPGPGEVLVKVRAVSLNRRDGMIRDLSYPAFADRFTPLSDAAGEIVAVGTGVAGWTPGDKVTSLFFQNWPQGRISLAAVTSALGAGGPGVLADHVVLSAEGVAAAPAGMGFEAAATLPCAGVTAWSALFTHGRLQPGDWVLVIGTGGVALFGLQFAVAAGARVAVISSSDEKLERAKAMGAEVAVNYLKTPDWEVAVREATGGVDHVLELGGAGTLPKSAAVLGIGGHLAVIGGLSGFGGELSTAGLIMGAQRVTAVTVGSRADHVAMVDFIETHRLEPQIDSVIMLDAVEDAYARANAGAFGKVVVKL